MGELGTYLPQDGPEVGEIWFPSSSVAKDEDLKSEDVEEE